MTWKQIEATTPHLTYLILSSFLILYALFSHLIRNRLHLSEPPLATLVGIIFGPLGAGVLDPHSWGWQDNITQEATRLIVGIQCFAVGGELPKAYFARHWRSVLMMLGPVMAYSWGVTALCTHLVLGTDAGTSLVIGACLAPTDPVLAASVLADSKFSGRVPARLRHMLAAESACNDGVSFPFLYAALLAVISATVGAAVKEWFVATLLWQCAFGLLSGVLIGQAANKLLRYSESRDFVGRSSFLVFYLLLAIFAIGLGSTLGTNDFLVAFGAGTGFAWDGWFARKTKSTHLPNIIDLLLNSSMFVYFGASIPWTHFRPGSHLPTLTIPRLLALLALILVVRRIPIVLALKRWVPDIRTYREALFCGHFGPMGLGALFLTIEARAQLETSTAEPLPHPPAHSPHKGAIEIIWPVICFVVLGSTMVHGLSVAVISVGSHYSRQEADRAPLIGGESEGLAGMEHQGGGGESEPSVSGSEDDGPEI